MVNHDDDLDTADDRGADDPQGDAASEAGLREAAAAVRRARHEFRRAREAYQRLRKQASDELREFRERSVGDVIDGTVEYVQTRPGRSALVAFVLGLFMGRLFRR